MARFLEFLFIALLIIAFVWAIYSLIKPKSKGIIIQSDEPDDLDELIRNLNDQITQAEKDAEQGIKTAESELINLKARLKKASEMKNKFFNHKNPKNKKS